MIRFVIALLCLASIAQAGNTRAAAIVAVAIAIDDMVQESTPDLPDTLDQQRPGEAEPRAVLSIDPVALESIPTKARKRTVVTVYSPTSFPCVRCKEMEADAVDNGWHSGDGDIELRWVKSDVIGAPQYPWITANGHNAIYGKTNLAGLRLWLKLPSASVSAAVAGVTVGSIDGTALRAFLASIKPDGSGQRHRVMFGTAAIILPPAMRIDVAVATNQVTWRFSGTKPLVSFGSGWLSVAQPINSLTLTPDTLGVGIDGFPDLQLRVE